jgi:hypothetical protein
MFKAVRGFDPKQSPTGFGSGTARLLVVHFWRNARCKWWHLDPERIRQNKAVDSAQEPFATTQTMSAMENSPCYRPKPRARAAHAVYGL